LSPFSNAFPNSSNGVWVSSLYIPVPGIAIEESKIDCFEKPEAPIAMEKNRENLYSINL